MGPYTNNTYSYLIPLSPLSQLFKVMKYIHSGNCIHRDLKVRREGGSEEGKGEEGDLNPSYAHEAEHDIPVYCLPPAAQ